MRILAYDLSLTNSGWAVADIVDREFILKDFGAIGTKRYAQRGTGFRLKFIANELTALYKKYSPDKVLKERSFSNGRITATQQIFKVNGVWEMMTHVAGYDDYEEIAVTTVKKQVTGNGKASKEDVAEAVKGITGVTIKDNDITDAVAVAVAFCKREGLID